MSFHVAGQPTLVDECMKPELLAERIPVLENFFDHVADVRNLYEEHKTIINGRHRAGLSMDETLLHLARFPHALWASIVHENPSILQDKKAFYRKINDYPEYRTGHVKFLGVHRNRSTKCSSTSSLSLA